jgi:hypothetical protein
MVDLESFYIGLLPDGISQNLTIIIKRAAEIGKPCFIPLVG